MPNSFKTLLVISILLLSVSLIAVGVKAQDSMIEAEIHPSEGTADTDILIRFSTTNASIGNVEKADIFWDDFSIGLNEQGVEGADGSYNYHLRVPSEPPLSDVGNHTIRVDSLVLNYGQVSFNFTFTVTKYVPSPEFVALNATYYSLLANYTDLLGNYTLLLANYSELSNDYAALHTEHDQLLLNFNSLSANYNSLLANFNSLSANYNSMLTNYNSLYGAYISFLTNYTRLQGNFDSLSSNYNVLRGNYDSLNSSLYSLRSSYDALMGELAINRNISYVFIASTIALAVLSVYLILKRPKVVSKTRY